MGCTCVQSYDAPGNVQYTNGQIQALWIQAGGNPQAAGVAAAIAIHESGGNTTATCVNGGSGCSCNGCVDRGLWQIDSVHGAQSTYDPMGNARAAVSISNNGTNWGAWGDDYAIVTANGVPGNNPDNSAPINATNAAAGQGAVTTAFTWNPTTWLNPFNYIPGLFNGTDPIDQYIGKSIQGFVIMILNPIINAVAGTLGIAAGGAMVLFGIVTVVRNTQAGEQAERGVGTLAQTALSFWAPETAATTQYAGQPHPETGERPITTVTQRRRAPGAVRIGGRRLQYRPGTVQTEVQRSGQRTYGDTYRSPGGASVPDQLNGEAYSYQQGYERGRRAHARQQGYRHGKSDAAAGHRTRRPQ